MITESILTELETLIGAAYTKLTTPQVGTTKCNTTKRLASRMKTAIRGGGETPMGIKALNGSYGFTVTNTTDATHTILGGTVLGYVPANNYVASIDSIVVGRDLDIIDPVSGEVTGGVAGFLANNESAKIWFCSVDYYDTETSTIITRVTPKIVVNVLETASIESILNSIDYANLLDLPDGSVIISVTCINGYTLEHTQIFGSSFIDVRDIGYYAPTSNDDMLTDIFYAVDQYDTTQDSINRADELKNLVNAIKSHTEARSGLDFYVYWAAQGHTFTDEFRKLYAEITAKDISQEIGRFATAALTPTIAASNTFVEMPCTLVYVGPTTSNVATIALTGVRGAYTNILYANASLNNPATEVGRRIYVEDPSIVLNYVGAIKDTSNTWKTIGPLSVGSAGSAVTCGSYGVFVPSTAYIFGGVNTKWGTRRSGAELHPCETIYVGIPTYTASGTSFSVGTAGTKYIGVASIGDFVASPATIITINT